MGLFYELLLVAFGLSIRFCALAFRFFGSNKFLNRPLSELSKKLLGDVVLSISFGEYMPLVGVGDLC